MTGWFLPRMTLSHQQGHLTTPLYHCFCLVTCIVLYSPSLACFDQRRGQWSRDCFQGIWRRLMPFVCGDHTTVLLPQGSPVSYPRRSNSDAASHSRTLYFMFCVYQLFVFCLLWFSVCFMLGDCRQMNFELWTWTSEHSTQVDFSLTAKCWLGYV